MAKLSDAEKARRKIERKLKSLNERALKEVGGPGSIFAAEAKLHTMESAEWHQRRTVAESIERLHYTPAGPAVRGLKKIQLNAIEVAAAEMLGTETFVKLRDFQRRCYGDWLAYGYTFWADALTGEKVIVFAWHRIPADNTLGFSAVPSDQFPTPDWVAPMTKAEFYARWPYTDPAEQEMPESVELFERFMHAMGM